MSAIIVNNKFAGMNNSFKATHTKLGPGRVEFLDMENGKKSFFFTPEGAEDGRFVNPERLSGIVVQYHKMYGALTMFQQRHLRRLAESSDVTLQYFSKIRHGGKWKKAGNPTWKFTTNYRVILH